MSNKFILQGVTKDSHLDEVIDILSLDGIERIIISVAFLTQRGFFLLSDQIAPVADKVTILAGIRNGVTSAQGLMACVTSGCTTYTVDTGSRGVLFHPKIYLARSASTGRLLLGSANLTVGGLNSNIEASITVHADLTSADERSLVDDLESKIDSMIADYPQHVVQIANEEAIKALYQSGRVIDERVTRPPTPGGSSKSRDLDPVPQMSLQNKKLKLGGVTAIDLPAKAETEPEAAEEDKEVATLPGAPAADRLALIWQSNPLTRRALNIPTAARTNPTGSMFFTKGQIEGIDQRHFFREEVFAALDWTHDTAAGREHLERATADFRVVIKDINYGIFSLNLTHDSRTNSKAYDQNNSMTQIHWGSVKPLVAREDLLGRTLYLYRDEDQPDLFVLEID